MYTQKTLGEIMNLKGQTAIVTGGAMGIGLGISKRLAEAGANVVIVDLDREAGNKAAADIASAGFVASFIETDVLSAESINASIEFAKKTYGAIDILVNNAGIYPNMPVMSMDVAVFEKIIDVNLRGVFLFSKAAASVMIQQGKGGNIINISSIDSLHPSAIGLAAYDASKHGVWGFTKNMALEMAPHNIRVNGVAPGAIATPGTGAGKPAPKEIEEILAKFMLKIPMKRIGEPDEIGKAVLFLASDLSSYMTGTQIVVDGGVLLS